MSQANPAGLAVAEAVPAVEAAPAAATPPAKLPAGSKPRLKVVRGLRVGVEYPIYEGPNYIGRSDENPVDIDLDDQEAQERSWISRQHCLITFASDEVVAEDLNSANGTYINRARAIPGQKRGLAPGDLLQIGTIHLKLEV